MNETNQKIANSYADNYEAWCAEIDNLIASGGVADTVVDCDGFSYVVEAQNEN